VALLVTATMRRRWGRALVPSVSVTTGSGHQVGVDDLLFGWPQHGDEQCDALTTFDRHGINRRPDRHSPSARIGAAAVIRA